VDALNKLGLFYAPYDYSTALYYLQEARSNASDIDYPRGIGDSEYLTSRVYYYQDEYFIAKTYLEKAYKTYESIAYKDGLADYYFAKGELEMLFGNYVKAIEAYQESLQLEKETGDQRGQSIILNCLSGFHREQGNLEEAMTYAKKALAIREEIQDSAGLGTSYTSIAGIYEANNQLDSAELLVIKGLEIRKAMGEVRRVGASHYMLGRLLVTKEKYLEALNYLNKAYITFKNLEEKTGMIIVRMEQGKAHRMLGNVDLSKELVEEAHELAIFTENNNLIKDTYKTISDYYIDLEDYQNGFDYYVLYKTVEDSISNWRKSKLIDEMEMRFQNQQKDSEIEKLVTANELQGKNNIILWLSLISLLAFSLFVFYLYRVKAQNLRQNQQLLEKEKIIYHKDHQMQENERKTLEDQLESKNREIGAKILSMLRTNEMQETLVSRLGKLTKYIGTDKKALKELNGIIRELESHSAENLWEEFDKTFQSIHSDFYKSLLAINPDLKPSEIKLAAFLKLNLSTKEIAALTFKTESGIKSTRHRLRKKLNLNAEENLVSFLLQL